MRTWWPWHARPKAVERGQRRRVEGECGKGEDEGRHGGASTAELVSEATGTVDLTVIQHRMHDDISDNAAGEGQSPHQAVLMNKIETMRFINRLVGATLRWSINFGRVASVALPHRPLLGKPWYRIRDRWQKGG